MTKKSPWPADKVERRSTAELVPDAKNARLHTPEQVAQIADAITEWGWTNPVLVDEKGKIIAGTLPEQVDAAEDALRRLSERDPFRGAYAREWGISTPIRLPAERDSNGIIRPHGALAVMRFTPDVLRCELTRAATWQRWNAKEKRHKPDDAPRDVARTIVEKKHWPRLRPLLGVTEAPTLRGDGSVLDASGYDPATGILYEPNGTIFDPIPAAPTKEDARRALEKLRELLTGFPFVSDADRSVALAALLTAVVRRSLPTAPMFGFSAPTSASGKTLLASLPSLLAAGRAPYLLPPASREEEESKRLLAVFSEGPISAVIDNVESTLRSAALCVALTSPNFNDRVLGVSETKGPPTNVLICVTGNGLSFHGDLNTRALLCQIDPQMEDPGERRFKVNLHEEMPRRRGELVPAALTVIRAYLTAGRPLHGVRNFARFEQWSAWCREPLIWLDQADPLETSKKLQAADPERDRLGALIDALAHTFGEGAGADHLFSTSKICSVASHGAENELRSVIFDIAGRGEDGLLNSDKLGRYIRRRLKTIVDGRSIRLSEQKTSNSRPQYFIHRQG